MHTVADALGLLGAGRAFKADLSGERELHRLVERGLPRDSVEILIESVPKAGRPGWRSAIATDARGDRLSTEGSDRAIQFGLPA